MKILQQTNSYNCGCMAVANAINRSGLANIGYRDIPELEKKLDASEETGIQEGPMLNALRPYFYVTIRYKYDKMRLDKWLKQGNQVILLYHLGKWLDEWHYVNIWRKITGKKHDIYQGANFIHRYCFTNGVTDIFLNKKCNAKKKGISVIYLRKREEIRGKSI